MRIKHIDALRGIAAISVTFFHLTGSSGLSLNLASYGKYGYLGVEVFFVISGFILPYSMHRTSYNTNDFGRFILKRIIRIYPAYFIAILLGIILPLLTSRAIVSLSAISAHFVFLNSILGLDWISPVFWTLAIEFQFYLLIGLLFEYISDSNQKSLILITSLTIISFFLKNVSFIFHWFPFFAIGMLTYNYKFTNMPNYLMGAAGLILLIIVDYIFGLPETIASAFAFLFIIFIKMENKNGFNKIMLWLGAISYSLYLVHWDVGRTVVGLSRHIPVVGHYEALRVCIGLIASILAAYLLYILIEKPSIKFSGKIKYYRSH